MGPSVLNQIYYCVFPPLDMPVYEMTNAVGAKKKEKLKQVKRDRKSTAVIFSRAHCKQKHFFRERVRRISPNYLSA